MKISFKMLAVSRVLLILFTASTMMATTSRVTSSGQQPKNSAPIEKTLGFAVERNTAGAVADKCGVEREAVKTSADQDASKVDFNPVRSTVAELNAIPAPTRAELDAHPDTRFPAELKTYTVEAYLDGFKLEADEDFHIVLHDLTATDTMVSEMPSENCVPAGVKNLSSSLRASWQTRFGKATKKYKKMAAHRIKIEVTGVGFFDFLHGQTGVAKNGFELHRIIGWHEVPDVPKTELFKAPRFDTGWWARIEWTASAFDASTTGLCVQNGDCYEKNPAARLFTGYSPSPHKLALGWLAESSGLSLIPNKRIRRIAQASAIGLHLYFGSRNLYRWH